MRKNVFEIVFIVSVIISSVLYWVYVPFYKGQGTFWWFGILLAYYFSRQYIISRSGRITSVILQLIEEFEEYSGTKKSLI